MEYYLKRRAHKVPFGILVWFSMSAGLLTVTFRVCFRTIAYIYFIFLIVWKKELHIFICDWKDREYSNGNQSQAYPFIIKLLFIAFRYELEVFGNFLFCFRATQSSLSNIRLIWIFLSILCVRACLCMCVYVRDFVLFYIIFFWM